MGASTKIHAEVALMTSAYLESKVLGSSYLSQLLLPDFFIRHLVRGYLQTWALDNHQLKQMKALRKHYSSRQTTINVKGGVMERNDESLLLQGMVQVLNANSRVIPTIVPGSQRRERTSSELVVAAAVSRSRLAKITKYKLTNHVSSWNG